MARLIALKQTAPERFLAQFDTGEALRTTLAVVTDYHLSCGKELTETELDALRAASAVKTGNAAGMAANETLASGEPQGPGMEYLGGHGVNPEYIDRELNPDAPEIPAGPAPVEGIIMDFETKEE